MAYSKPYITFSEHFACKYRVGTVLWIENKFKVNKQTKEISISVYVKLKLLKTWKPLKIQKTLK